MKSFRALLDHPPGIVPWSDVADFARLDERRACVDCLHANILGVEKGYVEWCPNDSPPSKDETLAWLWLIRPDLGEEMASDASPPLRNLMQKFAAGDMETWWREMT